jgi:UDP-N-acetylmuramyl tripeptide synthase
VHWVAAGMQWQLDAVGCPSCDGRIAFDATGWSCEAGCGFVRPLPDASLVGEGSDCRGLWSDGRSISINLELPGRFNQANALMAAVAAEAQAIDASIALEAMAGIRTVAGRFTIRQFGQASARLMLAKNPAGWSELLDLVAEDKGAVVVSINSRVADGADPSWLWDVPFERLAGRRVVATGDRCRDLAVRLQYAGVDHMMEGDPVAAISVAATDGEATIDVIGNYTAFNELLGRGSEVAEAVK